MIFAEIYEIFILSLFPTERKSKIPFITVFLLSGEQSSPTFGKQSFSLSQERYFLLTSEITLLSPDPSPKKGKIKHGVSWKI